MSADKPTNILLVEDDPDDVLLLKEALAESSTGRFHVIHTGRLDNGLDRIARGNIDAVMLDLNLPDSRGQDTLKTLLSTTTDVPVVVMSDLEDETLALQAVQHGAQDYLVKGRDDGQTITHILHHAIERHQLRQELKKNESRMRILIEKNVDGILIVNHLGIICYLNPAAERLFKKPAASMIGQPFDFPVATDEQTILEIFNSQAETTYVELHAAQIEWEGQPAFLTSLRDITERVQAERKLSTSEARLKEAQRIAHIGSWELDLQTNRLIWSDEIYRIFDVEPQFFCATYEAFLDMVHPDDREWVDKVYTDSVRNKTPYDIVHRLLMKDGNVKFVNEHCETYYDKDGKPINSIGTVQDITERRQMERLKEVLFNIANVANSPASLEELYQAIHAEVGKLLPAENFHIAIHDPDKDEISFPYFVDQYDSPPAPRKLGRGLTEYVLRTRVPLLAAPQEIERLVQQGEVELIGKQSVDWLGVPLLAAYKTIGVMVIQTYSEQVRFGPREATVLPFIASQVAMAIARKQAEQQIQQQVETLDSLYNFSRSLMEMEDFDAILDLITQRAVEITHVTFARVFLLEQDDLVARSVFPVRVLDKDLQTGQREPLAAHPCCQRILEKNTPRLLSLEGPDADDCASFSHGIAQTLCVVPLCTRERRLGLLMLGEARAAERESFTDAKVRLTLNICEQAASTLQRKLLHQETRRRIQHIESLHTIDKAVSGSLDLHLTLNIAIDQVMNQLGVDAVDVLLLNPYTQMLEYAAARGFRSSVIQHSRLRLGEGHAGRAALERRTVSVNDLHKEIKEFTRADLLAGENFKGYHCLPLVAKGQVKGVLEVYLRAHRTVDNEWMNFLETLAGQMAIAVDNASLFDSLQRSNLDLHKAYDTTIEGWSAALDLRDKETEGHTLRVTEMTARLAQIMGMGDEDLGYMRRGALLHDIGKMGVPDAILLKPGKLTDAEWELMRQHPTFAYKLLSPIPYLQMSLDIPYCHHEKWDGSGYPRGLKGKQIPLAARIFAVVDVWDALTSDRPYRKAWPKKKVIAHIKAESGAHFDPQVVDVFLKLTSEDTRKRSSARAKTA